MKLSKVLLDSQDITNLPSRTNHQREMERNAIRENRYRSIGIMFVLAFLIGVTAYLKWVQR